MSKLSQAAFIRFCKQAGHQVMAWYKANDSYIKDRSLQYACLMRLDRPIGSLLLLWPTLGALWIASEDHPGLHLFMVFTLGVFLTRSAGCVINDYADRNYDRHVERTRDRPLTTGTVTTKEAFLLIAALLLIAFILVLTTNRLTILLSFCAVLIAGTYPFMKRFTYIPQFFMGIAFSWGIIMAFAATQNTVPVIAWLIFIANVLWAMAYDTMYAMVDREYDLQIGIKSMAILFDEADTLFIGIFQILFFLVWVIIARRSEFGAIFYVSLIVAAAIAVYHQYLMRKRLPEDCFRAFLHNNWLGAVVFTGIVLHYN